MLYNLRQKVILRDNLYHPKWNKSFRDSYTKLDKTKPLTIIEIVCITEIRDGFRYGFEEIGGLWSENQIKCLYKD